MKTKKLNLNELKVESFVTSLEGKDAQTVKGGNPGIIIDIVMSMTIYAGVAIVGTAITIAAIVSIGEDKEVGKKEECKK